MSRGSRQQRVVVHRLLRSGVAAPTRVAATVHHHTKSVHAAFGKVAVRTRVSLMADTTMRLPERLLDHLTADPGQSVPSGYTIVDPAVTRC